MDEIPKCQRREDRALWPSGCGIRVDVFLKAGDRIRINTDVSVSPILEDASGKDTDQDSDGEEEGEGALSAAVSLTGGDHCSYKIAYHI